MIVRLVVKRYGLGLMWRLRIRRWLWRRLWRQLWRQYFCINRCIVHSVDHRTC